MAEQATPKAELVFGPFWMRWLAMIFGGLCYQHTGDVLITAYVWRGKAYLQSITLKKSDLDTLGHSTKDKP